MLVGWVLRETVPSYKDIFNQFKMKVGFMPYTDQVEQ